CCPTALCPTASVPGCGARVEKRLAMRILLFIHSLMGGGAERVATNLANHWAAKEWEVTSVTLAAKHLDAYELDGRVERIALGFVDENRSVAHDAWKNARRVSALRRVLRDVRP